MAAWPAKWHAPATLRELAEPLGLTRPQSVGNLTRRIKQALRAAGKLRRTSAAIEARIAVHLSKTTAKPETSRIQKKKNEYAFITILQCKTIRIKNNQSARMGRVDYLNGKIDGIAV